MRKRRTAEELAETQRCAMQIRRFYQAWYRNCPDQKPKRGPVTDADFDKWLAKLLKLKNYSAINNARLGNAPLGRERIESLHKRLRHRLNKDQRGVLLWCLHWVKEDPRLPHAKAIPAEAKVVTLRKRISEVYLVVGAALDPRSITIGEKERIRGGGFRIPIKISYNGSSRNP